MTGTMTTDLELLRTRVTGAVGRQRVRIRRVGTLDRDPLTGKARRFVPLPDRIP